MERVLIITDNSISRHVMEDEFSRFGWVGVQQSVHTLFIQGRSITKDFENIILIIDHNFRKNFQGVVEELESLINICSKYSAIYLLFEDDYDPIFASWLPHIKGMFKSFQRNNNLDETMKSMINFNFESVTP